jgi:flagellar biosynthetic protein FliO
VETWDILKIFIILGIMMGIMYGLLYLVKKYIYSFDKKGNNNSKIKVISTQTILPKKFVSLIQLNNTIYLLGVSDQSVNLIDKFDEEELVEEEKSQSEFPRQNFLKLLKANMGFK